MHLLQFLRYVCTTANENFLFVITINNIFIHFAYDNFFEVVKCTIFHERFYASLQWPIFVWNIAINNICMHFRNQQLEMHQCNWN